MSGRPACFVATFEGRGTCHCASVAKQQLYKVVAVIRAQQHENIRNPNRDYNRDLHSFKGLSLRIDIIISIKCSLYYSSFHFLFHYPI